MIEMTLPVKETPETTKRPARSRFTARQRRLRDDTFLASLMNPAQPANRAERREREGRMRRALSRLRAQAREIKQKREYRAWCKARRAVRSA